MEVITIIERSDRILWMRFNNQELTGINFMHGTSDLEHFDEYKQNDKELRDFVNEKLHERRYYSDNIISRVDHLISDYLRIKFIREEIANLKKTFSRINDLWMEAGADEHELLELNYPFNADFNELTQDVQKWTCE